MSGNLPPVTRKPIRVLRPIHSANTEDGASAPVPKSPRDTTPIVINGQAMTSEEVVSSRDSPIIQPATELNNVQAASTPPPNPVPPIPVIESMDSTHSPEESSPHPSPPPAPAPTIVYPPVPAPVYLERATRVQTRPEPTFVQPTAPQVVYAAAPVQVERPVERVVERVVERPPIRYVPTHRGDTPGPIPAPPHVERPYRDDNRYRMRVSTVPAAPSARSGRSSRSMASNVTPSYVPVPPGPRSISPITAIHKTPLSLRHHGIANTPMPPMMPTPIREIDYEGMSDEQKEKMHCDIDYQFDRLHARFPQWKITDPGRGVSLENRHNQYKLWVRQIHVSQNATQWSGYMHTCFISVELLFTYIFRIDMTGYTAEQLRSRQEYEMLLMELGEQHYSEGGSGWTVEWRLAWMALMNAVIFLAARFISKLMGPNGNDIVGTIRDMVTGMARHQMFRPPDSEYNQASAPTVNTPSGQPDVESAPQATAPQTQADHLMGLVNNLMQYPGAMNVVTNLLGRMGGGAGAAAPAATTAAPNPPAATTKPAVRIPKFG